MQDSEQQNTDAILVNCSYKSQELKLNGQRSWSAFHIAHGSFKLLVDILLNTILGTSLAQVLIIRVLSSSGNLRYSFQYST